LCYESTSSEPNVLLVPLTPFSVITHLQKKTNDEKSREIVSILFFDIHGSFVIVHKV